jgi:plasmid stabilization system protein ParE
MAQIVWTERAWNEYRKQLLYSKEEFGAKAAKHFFNNVSKRLLRLENYPLTGFIEPLLTNFKEGFRSTVVLKNFKLVYHYVPENDIVYIDDVWDMRREPSSLVKRVK